MKKLLAIFICIFILCACAPQSKPGSAADSISDSCETASEPTVTETPPDSVCFTAYRGNENADGLLSREVYVQAITPRAVLSALVEDGVLTDDVSVLEMRREGDELFLDFNTAFADRLNSVGTAGESVTIAATVNTFLSAYNARTVLITVEGNTLESGHVIYDMPLTYTE